MMEPILYALVALVTLCIGALGTGLVLLIRAQASVKDRELLHKTLCKFADRMMTEKDEQIERQKIEAQVEIGADYMQAQRDIAKVRGRHNGMVVAARQNEPDVTIPMDEN